MERGALSTSLLVLLVLFLIQFFLGMAQNLLVPTPATAFPNDNSAYPAAFAYVLGGGDWVLTSHFLIDTLIIAVGIANIALTIHTRNIYKILSIISFISVLSAFVNGIRFVASNFSIDGISFGMAGGYIAAFSLYFAMAMLMYRDFAVKT